jgi:NAD(P)H-hydrate epimerase
MFSLSCSQVRQVDQDAIAQLGLPGLILMENAARGVCDAVVERGPWNSITILAGPGNNGGDGLAVARLLAAMGIESSVLLIRGGKALSEDAALNLSFLQKSGITIDEPSLDQIRLHIQAVSPQDLIIDALLGTGIRGSVSSPFADVIQMANESTAYILSVDVPSGMDCDLGTPCGDCIRARTTVTFVTRKNGFLNPAAGGFTGEIKVCHIGIPQQWLEKWYALLPIVTDR